MKYKGQGKKNYLVIKWIDSASEWQVISNPVTHNQAMWHIIDKPHLKRDLVRVDLWENGYRPKPIHQVAK